MKKLVVIGSSEAGKTSLVERLVYNSFTHSESTIGAAFTTLELNPNLKIGIWDTAGQERYNALVPLYFRDASLALIIVDITSRYSLDGAKKWIEYLRNHHTDLSYVIVATKIDLIEKRTVYQDDLDSLPVPIIPPISVSALSCINIPKLKVELETIMSSDEVATPPTQSPKSSLNLMATERVNCC